MGHQMTYSICVKASWSVWSFATRGNISIVVLKAHIEKTSAMGLLPWYAGRNMGFAGRGERSV